jgi:DNA-binding CsgD family transcriptional regulator
MIGLRSRSSRPTLRRVVARDRARSRCTGRLEQLAASTLDVDELRLEAVEQLRQAIGFELWGVPLVDPDTLIANRAVVSDVPPWGRGLPHRWVLDQSLGEINNRAMLARGRDHVGVLSAATRGDLARCRRWREWGAPIGMGDELRAAIVDEHGCWGSFELFRASDDPPFDSDDAQLASGAARILAPALRHGVVSPINERGHGPDQTGVLLIDNQLRPHGLTPAAHEWIPLLDARQKTEATPLPIHVYQVIGRLLAMEAGDDPDRPPRVRVRTSDARWAIIEAARVDGMPNMIAVNVGPAGLDDARALISRAYGLTARERELLALVLEGLDTRELAKRMFISTYTVKDHLKAVFDKTGVHSRRELVTGLFGQAA